MQILLEDLFNSMGLLEKLISVLIMYLLSDNKDIHEIINMRFIRGLKGYFMSLLYEKICSTWNILNVPRGTIKY